MRAMLPGLHELSVLDLGCGFGWFCRWARENGATRVLGLDVSERMLERARATTNDPAIAYAREDMEKLELPPAEFDLVYSSLALHYIADFPRLMGQVQQALRPGGALVFSVEHPIFTAPSAPGWKEDGGHRVWPVDDYAMEGQRSTDWLSKGVIKHHRTLATYLNTLLALGFSLHHVEEWTPTDEQIALRPEWAQERDRPPFLLVSARR
jgi:SAM-dependent methyltransferase